MRIAAFLSALLLLAAIGLHAQPGPQADSAYIAEHYDKAEYRVPMRDGTHLFTAVYTPKDQSQAYPVLLHRTTYRAYPYGPNKMRVPLGPSMEYAREGFVFVYQDVRGMFMSEGTFENMRPHRARKLDREHDIDESTDTYDTIEWLLRNVKGHNGKVGMWGISYPGFYTIAGAIDAHRALAAVSPQAPIADWFFDDFHHHGAFFLPHAFNFLANFDRPKRGLTQEWPRRFEHGTPDGYQFFLDLGPLQNAKNRYFGDSLAFWNQLAEHPNYDGFWKARNLLPHLRAIQPAVLTVGGWYDAEDLYGPLKIYRAVEANAPAGYNGIVMGPWRHGGWARDPGSSLGNVFFGDSPAPSEFYLKNIELPFFLHHLKGAADPKLAEAYMFETGRNAWRTFEAWPPKNTQARSLFLQNKQQLSLQANPDSAEQFSEFVSDPAKPVPFTEAVAIGMTREYMTDDQRFASRRPDVLVFQTEVLEEDMTLAGPMLAKLFVSTTGTDADWVVKVIDVYPPNHPAYPHQPGKPMGNYQQMVRSEVIRGRFRNGYERPEPFVPGQVAEISLELQDVLHTFKKGHRIMVHIQSTWFPLVDRNPQRYVENLYLDAVESDFIPSTHRVYHDAAHPSRIEVQVIP
jgi:hypothetical protein